ncbi:eukaryotic porin/Tom40 [Chytriomyces sp. MP71]|nr:eukaryotic porin/Tom40 [Chytriomyces sp. MP71]
MAIPANYSDFSKDLNDLLNKDFPLGFSKLEINQSTSNGIKVTVNNVKNSTTGAIASDLKTKYCDKANGLTVTNTYHASNVLTAQVELQDLISHGFKLDIHGSLHPTLGTTSAKAGLELQQANVFARSSIDLLAKSGATIHTDVVVGSEGLLLGGDVAYNSGDSTIHRYNVAVGYKTPEYTLGFHATKKFTHFTAGYFHNIHKGLQVGTRASWDQAANSEVGIEIGSKYAFGKDAFVKTKINNVGVLGLGYTQILRPGVKVSLGGSFDTTRLHENVHKVGVHFVFDN